MTVEHQNASTTRDEFSHFPMSFREKRYSLWVTLGVQCFQIEDPTLCALKEANGHQRVHVSDATLEVTEKKEARGLRTIRLASCFDRRARAHVQFAVIEPGHRQLYEAFMCDQPRRETWLLSE